MCAKACDGNCYPQLLSKEQWNRAINFTAGDVRIKQENDTELDHLWFMDKKNKKFTI